MRFIKYRKLVKKNQLLMENTQEMVLFFDSKGKVLECNEQAIQELGYGKDIYRCSVQDIFNQAFSYNHYLKLDSRFLNTVEETVAYRMNQTSFPAKLKVSMPSWKKGFIGLCTAVNMTAKKKMALELNDVKIELNKRDQMASDLIANVTHELRTPINGIVGFSNSLLDSELNQRQREDIDVILRCCTNMNAIINDILDYTKMKNNMLVLEHRDFNFRELIHQVVELNSTQIQEKGLRLFVNISDDIPETVKGDELRLSQIINNLLSNAVKFTAAGQIGLEVTKIVEEDHSIELFFMVIDTGIGIGPEEKDKLFRSFSQIDSSISRRFGGTGLGLSICKRLIEAMDGMIQVESEKGKGSIFSFSIHLGLPQTEGGTITPAENASSVNPGANQDVVSEYNLGNDPMGETLDISARFKKNQEKRLQEQNDREVLLSSMKNLSSEFEKIGICIDMENWEMAEELIYDLKNKIPRDHTEVSKKVLKLLLTVRKENNENSVVILNELKEALKEEQKEE